MAFKGASMRGWVASEIWNHPHRFEAARRKILAGLEQGRLEPVIAKAFKGLESLTEANAFLESNQQVGKVVVEF
jgi:NADPH:quinone reductase-like Zn-dependent oxidoreductase